METRGIPVAVVCTEPFRPTADAICQARGVPTYAYAVVEHPIGSLSLAELRRRAAEAADQVFALLTGTPQRHDTAQG